MKNSQTNDYPKIIHLKITCALTWKIGISLHCVSLEQPIQFIPVNLEFTTTTMIILLIDINLYNVLFFLFFYLKPVFFNGCGGYKKCNIPFSSEICQNKPSFLLKLFRCWFRICCGNIMEQFFHPVLIIKKMTSIIGL